MEFQKLSAFESWKMEEESGGPKEKTGAQYSMTSDNEAYSEAASSSTI